MQFEEKRALSGPEPPPVSSPAAAEAPALAPVEFSLALAPSARQGPADRPIWLTVAALVVILGMGAYFRFVGPDWDSGNHLHPDERFMTSVADAIHPVKSIFEYFDTANSSLNPFPSGSFTYGMFPLFLVRYVGEIINMSHYDKLVYVGRAVSGVFDLAAVLMLYLLGARLYGRRVGLLAAALSAAAVLPIQLSHYFAVDTFATIFILAAFYVAVPTMENGRRWHYLAFGLLSGLATACKINTAPVAGVILVTGAVRLGLGWRGPVARRALLGEVLLGWLIAGITTAVTFRVFQPYAFTGPGFFDIGLNQRWVDIMTEVTNHVAGRSDFPPNHHWTDRSQLTFAWIQMAVWGLGLPLGLMATLGWAWAAWRGWREAAFQKGEWQGHLLLVLWVGGYFAWQNAQFWRYMRYFMPIYPLAILLAAWLLIRVLDLALALPQAARTIRELRQRTLLQILAIGLVAGVTLFTYAYAFAFTRIYTRSHTRVAASDWIMNNIPGPLNFQLQTRSGAETEPYTIPYDLVLKPGEPWRQVFVPIDAGEITSISAFHLYAPDTSIYMKIARDAAGSDIAVEGRAVIPALPDGGSQSATVLLRRVVLAAGQTYYLHYTIQAGGALTASNLWLASDQEQVLKLEGSIATPNTDSLDGSLAFTLAEDMSLDRVDLGTLAVDYAAQSATVKLTLSHDNAGQDKLAESEVTIDLSRPPGPAQFELPAPVAVDPEQPYYVTLEVRSGAPVRPVGATLAMETSWDDSLPLRSPHYDPLGGIYRVTNLDLYEPDDAVKRSRMLDVLRRSDYLIVSSNRAYDAMPRLPLRYPLTLKYYQALFGCSEQLIIYCAYPAQAALQGPLGYELVKVTESNPNLGPLEFSDQWAEEAFTVYDHPKVMIFKRSADYSTEQTAGILDSVDLSQIVDQSPAQYTAMPGLLQFTPDRLAAQTDGGTWSGLFDPNDLLNSNQTVAGVIWYGLLTLIGAAAWPIVFTVFKGLPDRGYPLSRLVGLVIVTWMAWFGASYKIYTFSRPILWLLLAGVVALSAFIVTRRRAELVDYFRRRLNYIAVVEGVSLLLFLFFLGVRLINPDLWHPWLGGEKPADFSFFQAAVRSVYFPPYDVWLSGHYVNYYYYGFVLAAVPTKFLGVIPSIAYNLVIPMLFSLAGLGAFCAAYNLVAAQSAAEDSPHPGSPYVAGVAAVVLTLLVGNLYQVRELWQYLPAAADPPATYSTDFLDQSANVLDGGWRLITGQTGLPQDKGAWYFGPSRAILHDGPDTPITEFPLFSFLYADLHPHLSSISLMLAAMGWMISTVFAGSAGQAGRPDPPASTAAAEPRPTSPASWRRLISLESILYWGVGGLIFGALLPTQTWDFPGFIVLGVLAVAAAVGFGRGLISRAVVGEMLVKSLVFVGLAVGLYYPFRQWFATDYSAIDIWIGARTPINDYLTVHGLFLLISVSWLAWQSRALIRRVPAEYLLNTPLGELLPPIRLPLIIGGGLALALLIGAVWAWGHDYQIFLIAIPLGIWAAALFLQPDQSVPQRVWLVLFAVGVGLTILVEIVTLKGDLGRSNTVFKFYIEVWLFFSVAAGSALAWLGPVVRRQWPVRLRRSWLAGVGLVTAAAATYPVIGIYAKVTDRWPAIDQPPHTLDGAAYMLGSDSRVTGDQRQTAYYDDEGVKYNLASDYDAVRWLQDNVAGTPAIMEGNTPLYRWGSRIAIYSGLPTVIGWDYHVSQHDSILPGTVVTNRLKDVRDFYSTTDPDKALRILQRYQVRYVILGALERKYYAGDGLAKFETMVANRQLDLAYASTGTDPDQTTYIYHVPNLQSN